MSLLLYLFKVCLTILGSLFFSMNFLDQLIEAFMNKSFGILNGIVLNL